MNKHITYLAVAAIAVTSVPFLSSCRIVKVKKNVETITRRLDLKDFNKIEVNGACDLEYTQGPYSVTVTMPKEIGKNVITSVNDSLLKIEDRCFGSTEPAMWTSRTSTRRYCIWNLTEPET